MHQVYLSLGSNIGKRKANLNRAITLLGSEQDCIGKVSSIYETEPWGCSHQRNFFNQVVELMTCFSAVELLERLHEIEKLGGRKLTDERYADRTLDIDILFYEQSIITSEPLKIPHSLIHKRLFVLIPLAEIAPDFIHPVFGKTVSQLLAVCEDEKKVLKIKQ
jgi:2-amino-4-hydroxy-6-hydroxymethyldihydropteridine diphosphokinase